MVKKLGINCGTACPMKCPFCTDEVNLNKTPNVLMDIDFIKDALDKYHPPSVSFCGTGECTIVPNFLEIVDTCLRYDSVRRFELATCLILKPKKWWEDFFESLHKWYLERGVITEICFSIKPWIEESAEKVFEMCDFIDQNYRENINYDATMVANKRQVDGIVSVLKKYPKSKCFLMLDHRVPKRDLREIKTMLRERLGYQPRWFDFVVLNDEWRSCEMDFGAAVCFIDFDGHLCTAEIKPDGEVTNVVVCK